MTNTILAGAMIECPRCGAARLASMPYCRHCRDVSINTAKRSKSKDGANVVVAKPHEPNMTEREYYEMFLRQREMTGEISCVQYEAFTLRLADRCKYTPDWSYWEDGVLVMVECKGPRAWDDAMVKFKVAVEMYPRIKFIFAKRLRKGKWKVTEHTNKENT